MRLNGDRIHSRHEHIGKGERYEIQILDRRARRTTEGHFACRHVCVPIDHTNAIDPCFETVVILRFEK